RCGHSAQPGRTWGAAGRGSTVRNASPIVAGTKKKWLIVRNANLIRARSTFAIGHLRRYPGTVRSWSLSVMVIARRSPGHRPDGGIAGAGGDNGLPSSPLQKGDDPRSSGGRWWTHG